MWHTTLYHDQVYKLRLTWAMSQFIHDCSYFVLLVYAIYHRVLRTQTLHFYGQNLSFVPYV